MIRCLLIDRRHAEDSVCIIKRADSAVYASAYQARIYSAHSVAAEKIDALMGWPSKRPPHEDVSGCFDIRKCGRRPWG